MTKQRLDAYDSFPPGMREYLEVNGWHFSKKMCDWAVSKMKQKDTATGKEKRLEPASKEAVEEMLRKFNIRIENGEGYDMVYVANMAKADYFKSSIADEQHLAMFVKDYIDDVDAYPGMPFTRFVADCIGNGCPIMWEDLK